MERAKDDAQAEVNEAMQALEDMSNSVHESRTAASQPEGDGAGACELEAPRVGSSGSVGQTESGGDLSDFVYSGEDEDEERARSRATRGDESEGSVGGRRRNARSCRGGSAAGAASCASRSTDSSSGGQSARERSISDEARHCARASALTRRGADVTRARTMHAERARVRRGVARAGCETRASTHCVEARARARVGEGEILPMRERAMATGQRLPAAPPSAAGGEWPCRDPRQDGAPPAWPRIIESSRFGRGRLRAAGGERLRFGGGCLVERVAVVPEARA
eukprot:7387558-Prymnesium_polylepis.1